MRLGQRGAGGFVRTWAHNRGMLPTRDRYSRATHSHDLRGTGGVDRIADVDVLGAAGIAAKRTPLGIALLRLQAGDGGSAEAVAAELASMAWSKARSDHVKLKRERVAQEGEHVLPVVGGAVRAYLARAVLAWHSDGRCKVCGGHGFLPAVGELGAGRTVLGDEQCQACHGTGRVPFDPQFRRDQVPIARWALDLIERQVGRAAGQLRAAVG